MVVKHFDVGAIFGRLTFRQFEVGAPQTPLARVVAALLRPIDLSAFDIEGDADEPVPCAGSRGIALSGLDQRLNIRTEPSTFARMIRIPSRSGQ